MATVLSVARSPRHGFSKEPVAAIELIAGEGVKGDAHRGRTVQHLYEVRRDPNRPNRAQVHLFAAEMLGELAGKGHQVGPGDLGENVLTEGLDLLTLPRGTVLRLGAATVELTGLRTPCSQIDRFQQGLQQHLWGGRDLAGKRVRRAGVMAVVLEGGPVRVGDAIDVVLPGGPHEPLGPV